MPEMRKHRQRSAGSSSRGGIDARPLASMATLHSAASQVVRISPSPVSTTWVHLLASSEPASSGSVDAELRRKPGRRRVAGDRACEKPHACEKKQHHPSKTHRGDITQDRVTTHLPIEDEPSYAISR